MGSVDIRRSSFRPCTMHRTRPSCGIRRSEMSRFAMIFRRDVIAEAIDAGGFIASNSSPSIRNRTFSFFSAGSI